jgi:hypothetical protein
MNQTRLPLRHISLRVPWHDTAWNGTVCKKPKDNAACMVLPRVRDSRDDTKETEHAGCLLSDMKDPACLPACMGERGHFMADFAFTRKVRQPYSLTSDHHKHMLSTDFTHPSYSAAAIPFRWMSKESDDAWDLAEFYDLDVDPDHEPTEPEWLHKNGWVQSHVNQGNLLNAFFGALRPTDSLCFFYAKQIPHIEDSRRVLIGVGRVPDVGKPKEYDFNKKYGLRAFLWDVNIKH